MNLPTPRRSKAKPAAKAHDRWQGALEGLHRGLLYGWAIDCEQPEARVVLEVCLNGEALGCQIADVTRSDLADRFAAALAGYRMPTLHTSPNLRHPGEGRDPVCAPKARIPASAGMTEELCARLGQPDQSTHDHCHGFVADLGSDAENRTGLLTVRVANTTCTLPGHVEQNAAAKPPVAATSTVFSDGGLWLRGWAIDAQDEKRTLIVRAFIGHRLIAETPANLAHPTLRSFDDGLHGFNLNLPLELANGESHIVRVLDDNGNALNGSPLTVCCYAAGGQTLLPSRTDGLLPDLIDTYERYLPRSLGMAHYAQWATQFETPIAPSQRQKRRTTPVVSTLRVGIIVTGGRGNGIESGNESGVERESDPAALARTTASLMQQTGASVQLFTPYRAGETPHTFSALLKMALQAPCDIIACVRAGDTLPSHALSTALAGFALDDSELIYTDSEYLGLPWFKPAWNPEYALASDYPLELMLVRSSVLRTYLVEHALPENAASLSWNLLAMLWKRGERAIVHVPRVLYQFNMALSASEHQARHAAARQALQALEPAASLNIDADACAKNIFFQPRRLQRTLSPTEQATSVSLIIPTRDRIELLERCLESIQHYTHWLNLEIIVVDNDSAQAKSKTYFRALAKQGIKVLPVAGAFNFATLNNRAVDVASGEIVGLINNDIEALHDGWLEEIVSHLLQPGVGAVGAKLLWPNGMVQHGGVLLGVGNVAGHFGNRLADADWGDHGRNQLTQQVSAVTAACLFLCKSDYLSVGGMDAHAFPVAFNDVDLCLKLRQQGKTIIWTPHARLLHAESASRGSEETPQKRARAQREIDQLRQRWGSTLLHDPAYHPSLNLDAHSHAFGGLALPPRNRAPRRAGLLGLEDTLCAM
jgi:GT2 family glycosyltransferase